MNNPFTTHPSTVGETYWKHFCTAFGFSFSLLGACFICTLHAIFPFMFQCTTGWIVAKLHEKIVVNRKKRNS